MTGYLRSESVVISRWTCSTENTVFDIEDGVNVYVDGVIGAKVSLNTFGALVTVEVVKSSVGGEFWRLLFVFN